MKIVSESYILLLSRTASERECKPAESNQLGNTSGFKMPRGDKLKDSRSFLKYELKSNDYRDQF